MINWFKQLFARWRQRYDPVAYHEAKAAEYDAERLKVQEERLKLQAEWLKLQALQAGHKQARKRAERILKGTKKK
jgi:hypothetical protein